MKRRALTCTVAITILMTLSAWAGMPVNDQDEILGRLVVEFSPDLSPIRVTDAAGGMLEDGIRGVRAG